MAQSETVDAHMVLDQWAYASFANESLMGRRTPTNQVEDYPNG